MSALQALHSLSTEDKIAAYVTLVESRACAQEGCGLTNAQAVVVLAISDAAAEDATTLRRQMDAVLRNLGECKAKLADASETIRSLNAVIADLREQLAKEKHEHE